jgi:predicted anti-sigma-YlaC factor YlaD
MSQMDCVDFVELVTAYLEGALDAETEQRVVDHLALCDGCERYLDQVRETVRRLGDLPPESLPGDARSALLAAFRDRPEPTV